MLLKLLFSFSSIRFSASLLIQSFIFSPFCGLFLQFHCSLSGNTLNYMWNVRGAPTFSTQGDIAVEFRSHQSKMHKIPLAAPPRCTSLCSRNNKNTSAAEAQHKRSPNMTDTVIQRVALVPLFFLLTATRGDALRWFEPPVSSSAMFWTFWEICPRFQRKEKTLRTKYLMLNSILCNPNEKIMLYSHSESYQFHFFSKIKGRH